MPAGGILSARGPVGGILSASGGDSKCQWARNLSSSVGDSKCPGHLESLSRFLPRLDTCN